MDHFHIKLQNLNGLKGLESIEYDLRIHDNLSLDDCCGIYTILKNSGVGGDIRINSNGGGTCDDDSDSILSMCEEIVFPNIPTLSQWGVIILGLLLTIISLSSIKENRVHLSNWKMD